MDEKIQIVMENLKKNNIEAHYAASIKDIVPIVESLLMPGCKIASGGSQSLIESGVYALISGGNYHFIDRTKADDEVYRQIVCADAYFCSSNAVTENGELYNVDGNSNRVSAILYGPKSVIMIVGKNKIVKDLNEAANRVKTIAAPFNCKRLSCDTYCGETGHCMSLDSENREMAAGCMSDARICCNFVVCAKQRHKNRIKVILTEDNLGY